MTRRELPPAEWPKLTMTALDEVWTHLRAGVDRVIVVEEGDRIVGCWTLVPVVHVEGIWIADDYRRTGNVARRLLAGVKELGGAMGAKAVITSAYTDEIAGLANRLGAAVLPGDHFVLDLEQL